MTDPTEFAELLHPLAELARAHGLHEIVLREPANLSWLFGARWNVPHTLESACFDVLLELAGLPVEWSTVARREPRDATLPAFGHRIRPCPTRPARRLIV